MIMANSHDKSGKKHMNVPMASSHINKDRIPSRHEKQRHEINAANSDQAQYYLFGDEKNKDGNMHHQHQRGPSDRQKTNIVEVLEFDQEVQPPTNNLFYSQNNVEGSSDVVMQ